MATGSVNKFQSRYFRWGVKSFADEIAHDFARLETTKAGIVCRLLSRMRALSPPERTDFARALIKRRRLLELNASEVDGENMTSTEISMCQRFFDDFSRSDEELELEEEEEQPGGSDQFKINRRDLVAMLRKNVGPLLGTEVETDGSVLTYEKLYQAWRITAKRTAPWDRTAQ